MKGEWDEQTSFFANGCIGSHNGIGGLCTQPGDISPVNTGLSSSDFHIIAFADLDANGGTESNAYGNTVAHTDTDTNINTGAEVYRRGMGVLGQRAKRTLLI